MEFIMNQHQLRMFAASQLPRYLATRYTLGKSIRRNNLRQGQKVIAITKDASQPFFFICEILGFGSFYDVDNDVCLSENIIPNTPNNKPFYQGFGLPVLQEGDDMEPVFFHRCKSEPADSDFLEESVRIYEQEMSPIGLSDEGFAAHEYCAPILVAKTLRRIQKKYILLQRHPELDNWMSPIFKPISWFELVST
jgi:hypothetical protein